jgi:hypothetical protein
MFIAISEGEKAIWQSGAAAIREWNFNGSSIDKKWRVFFCLLFFFLFPSFFLSFFQSFSSFLFARLAFCSIPFSSLHPPPFLIPVPFVHSLFYCAAIFSLYCPLFGSLFTFTALQHYSITALAKKNCRMSYSCPVIKSCTLQTVCM